jgi:nitrous oxidase accessory protein
MKCLFTILTFFILFAGFARTISVGPGQYFNSIKKAIDAAGEKDTILVQSGIYREKGLTLTKSLTLIGQNYPVLEGENKFEILLISGKNITIKGFRFHCSGYSALNDFASIKLVDCSQVLLENNIIEKAYFAIHVSNSSYVTIRGNRITGTPSSEQLTGNGIHLWKSNHALIENNQVQGHRDGIYFEFVTYSLIRNNYSQQNIRYGLHFMFSNDDTYQANTFQDNGAGVAVMFSKKVKMENNRFNKNWGPSAYGLLLKDITDSYIQHNTFSKNTIAVHMEGTSRISFLRNTFHENGWAIKVQASCDDNEFYQNNFTSNSFDVGTNGTMMLNKFYNNYWDKYEGYDMNKDGIGDLPYHPVSMYSMIIEQNPTTLILLRSFTVSLMDKAERAIPGLTPEDLLDNKPMMKRLKL